MKSDIANAKTEQQIKKLESDITSIFGEAQKDIEVKMADFTQKFADKYSIHHQELEDGKITQSQFDSWVKGQVFQGKQWQAKKDQMAKIMGNADKIAMKVINGESVNVFTVNANYTSYDLEHTEGINFGFGAFDNATVANLISKDPQILPKWKVSEPKNYTWNQKNINKAITQGIIQGESLDKISKRVASSLATKNSNTMKTFARTAMTGAQNAGRNQSLMNAKSKGISVVKQWMATLDGRTRDSHRHMDGETIKVGDKWHPQKFSNGCRFPGDPEGPPHEVYNCRCTMVGDVQGYPSIYERYDNIDGKPIKNMSYAEWYKTKYGKDLKPLKPKPSNKIDYAKYGGKEVYDILSKYDSFDDFLIGTTSSTYNQFQKVVDAFNGDNEAIKDAIKEIKASKKTQPTSAPKPKLTAEEKAQKKYEKAKADLDKIEQEIKSKGADKTFSGIWYNQTITYADWEAKKDSIQSKIEYYENMIKTYEEAGELAKAQFMRDKISQLQEFMLHGEEYSKLLAKRNAMTQTVSSLKPKPDPSKVFGADAYSQQRKNAALWAKNSEQADKALRQATKDVWVGATSEERFAAYHYTAGSGPFNRPLRGYAGSWSSSDFKGVGNVDLNHEGMGNEIKELTNLIDRSALQQDTWLQRGIDDRDGVVGFFGLDEDLLFNSTEEELQQMLVGKEVSDAAFMSCGSAKGVGFSGPAILNIYCPEGTKALYCEPFSRYGYGGGKSWDGISDQSSFGSELETLLQRGTRFRITKIEKKYGTIYVDMDVVDQKY